MIPFYIAQILHIITQIGPILQNHEDIEVRYKWLLDLSNKKKWQRKNVVKFGLRDEEYLREKRLNTFPLKELLVFGLHKDHLWFPKFKTLWASQTIHTYNYTQEKNTQTHTKTRTPSLFWKGYMAPSRQALFIQHVSASLGLLAWVRRGGVIYLILLWGHRHMEGDRSRPHTGHNTSVVLLNQDLLP